MPRRWPRFRPLYKGKPLLECYAPPSGLRYAPELEWRLAARWAGYRYDDEFIFMSGDIQAEIVAAYRIDAHAQAVQAYEARPQERR